MSSDGFDVTSRRLLHELHGQLVAEHRRQVAVIGSSCQHHISAPVKPESTEPMTPITSPPPLGNFLQEAPHRGSSQSLDSIDLPTGPRIMSPPAEGDLDMGENDQRDSLTDVASKRISLDSDDTVESGKVLASAFKSSDVFQLKVRACPLDNLVKAPLPPNMFTAEEDETPHSFPDGRPSLLVEDGFLRSGSSPAKSCLKMQGESALQAVRVSPRVSLVETPCLDSVSERLKAIDDFKGRKKSLSSMSLQLGKVSGSSRVSADAPEGGNRYHSQLHSFEVLEAWTVAGVLTRSRAFSVRTKSKLVSIQGDFVDVLPATEEGRQFLMINPNNLYHLLWDLFGLLMIAYDCIMVPMEVFEVSDTVTGVFMEWLIRLYWTLNILITFRTGFVHSNGAVEMRARIVQRRYIKSWLPLDLFCVAVDWSEALFPRRPLGRVLRILRALRTLRLFRLMKAHEISTFLNERIRSEKVQLSGTIFKIIIGMLGFVHLIACAWYAVGRFAEYGPGESNWIKEEGLQEEDVSQRYSWSLHWSLSMVAGELIVPPRNAAERIFTICVLLLGIMVSASFVSIFTSTLTQLQIVAREESSKVSILRRYLFDHLISRQLAFRIQKNAQHALAEQKRNAPESTVVLLTMISNPLLMELHFEMHSPALMQHPFFLHYNDINKQGVKKLCHIGITDLSLSAGDVLFHDLEVPRKKQVFFVTSGGLDYKREDKETMAVVKPSWLSEAVLWTTWTHCGTARAVSESRLMVLDGQVLQDCICSFPSEHARDYADAFVELLNSADAMELTDLALGPEEQQILIEKVFPDDSSEESSSEDDEEEDDSDDSNPKNTHSSEMSMSMNLQMTQSSHQSSPSYPSAGLSTNAGRRDSEGSNRRLSGRSLQSGDRVLGFESHISSDSLGAMSHMSSLTSKKKRRRSSKGSNRTSSHTKKSQLHSSKSRSQSLGRKRNVTFSIVDAVVGSTVGFIDRVRHSGVGSKIFGPSTKSSSRTSHSERSSARHRHGSLQSSLPVGVIPFASDEPSSLATPRT